MYFFDAKDTSAFEIMGTASIFVENSLHKPVQGFRLECI